MFCSEKGFGAYNTMWLDCALNKIFNNLNWEKKGIKINGELFNNLRIVDDMVIVAENEEDLQSILEDLSCEGNKADMDINSSKTNIPNNPNPVQLHDVGRLQATRGKA